MKNVYQKKFTSTPPRELVEKFGIDTKNNNHIKLFSFIGFVLLSLPLMGVFFGVHAAQFLAVGTSPSEYESLNSKQSEKKVRALMDEKMKLYKKQDTYYYGDMFREAYALCTNNKNYWKYCSPNDVFSPYLGDLVRYAQSMNAFLEAARSLDIVTAYNSSFGDFDNDGTNELILVLDDSLNHEYLTAMIVDQEGIGLKQTEQRIDRQYSGGPPQAVDVTGDAIPEIVVYSTGGRQDVQAYIFEYDAESLHLIQAFERDYLRSNFIYTDQNGNHIPEIVVRGERYGDECMACEHEKIEEVFEYNTKEKKFAMLSSASPIK